MHSFYKNMIFTKVVLGSAKLRKINTEIVPATKDFNYILLHELQVIPNDVLKSVL